MKVVSLIAALSAGIISASTIAASAADMPAKAPAFIPAPAYNWSGFYAGLNAGAAFGRAHDQTTPVFSPTGYFATTSVTSISAVSDQTMHETGFTGGGQIGYNLQNRNIVVGLETDFEYMGLNTSTTNGALYPCCAPTAYTINQSAKTEWLWTLRPRVGYAADNWLFYATGGLAVAQIKGDFLFTDTFATAHESGSISDTKLGWALGGGVEWGMMGPWSLKVEYLHVAFSGVNTTSTNLTAFTPPINFPTSVFTHSINLSEDIVRAGLNYRFHP